MDEFMLHFPAVLRKAIRDKLIELPAETTTDFEEFPAFRGVKISATKTTINQTDFFSQIEKKLAHGIALEDLDQLPQSRMWGMYSCSCFENRDELELALSLPQKKKKIAVGQVRSELGACRKDADTSHINWFLYEGADPSGEFQLI